jgi:hypothetical protein
VHSSLPSSIQSSAGLVHHQEKRLMNAHMVDPHHHEHLNFSRGGSLSPGASTIAASVEGSHHHHQQTIGALAKAGYRGKFYTPPTTQQLQTQNEDIEKDSISNSDTTRDLNIMSRSDHHRNKKLSWQHEDFQVRQTQG